MKPGDLTWINWLGRVRRCNVVKTYEPDMISSGDFAVVVRFTSSGGSILTTASKLLPPPKAGRPRPWQIARALKIPYVRADVDKPITGIL